MATLYASASASADRIRARAGQLDPLKVFIIAVCALPFLVFYVARFVWLVMSLFIAAGMEGWEAADRRIEARRPRADARGG